MWIVLTQAGITKFIAAKGDYGLEKNLDIDIIPGIPFNVSDELAQARIKASPNLFRAANKADEKFAEKYKAKKITELNELIEEKQKEVKSAKV